MMSILIRLKQYLGVLLLDYSRFSTALNRTDKSYAALCNRNELLEASTDGQGYRCQWQWTSDLHAPKYFPGLGMRLMTRAFSDHPIIRSRAPKKTNGKPDVTYIIGHRGSQRLPHLLATLEGIAGQNDAAIECIVVEQDIEATLAGRLPDWVKHIHTPPPTVDMPYCRSWAFNVGAKAASADVLVLHDNDMVIPADYSKEILAKVKNGFEVVNLKRFIFYLTEKHSAAMFENAYSLDAHAPESIMQNSEGGGSIAITKKAYQTIGGFDESFIGWGGEDNEFWERAQTLPLWPYAYLPLVHLWHAAQPGKAQSDNQTLKHYRIRSMLPAEMRINELRLVNSGNMSGPVGLESNE